MFWSTGGTKKNWVGENIKNSRFPSGSKFLKVNNQTRKNNDVEIAGIFTDILQFVAIKNPLNQRQQHILLWSHLWVF